MSEATGSSLNRYWTQLGLLPGSSLEKLDTTYYVLVEKFPKDPTEDEAKQRETLHHAYSVLRRSLTSREDAAKPKDRAESTAKRTATFVALLVVGGLFLLWMNLGEIELRMTDYKPGTMLHLKGKGAPYGTVVSFERAHSFGIGRPGPAYQISLHGSNKIVWLSERVVEKAMLD